MADEYAHLDEDFWFDVDWHLYNMRECQRLYEEEQGEHNLMQNDRYLFDASMGFRGEPDVDMPKWMVEESHAYREEQKKAATAVTLDNGAVIVYYDDLPDRVRISTGRGDAEVSRAVCAELGNLLISLQSTEPTGVMSSPAVSQKRKPLTQNEKVALYMQRKNG